MMVEKGTKFTFNGKLAKALEYMPFVGLWFCVYEEDEGYFYLFPEEIEKSRKEADKDMKLEYKFYEKNLAPKWLEGDYDLHIEGNRMTMTSKDGKKVEARCHPDDDWRLQVGIDELKERMAEVKKPREIKVGDKVKFVGAYVYNPKKLCDFFDSAEVSIYDIIRTMSTAFSGVLADKLWRYEVICAGNHFDSSINKNVRVALVRHEKTDTEFVVQIDKLELVS